MQGRVHSVETFGSVDGPGTRFLIFLQGCHMRCRYCHNADTWAQDGGTWRTAEELLAQAERYRPYWGREGGITVSGGEPLLQAAFLLELFTKAKARGISTCIDTSGQPFNRREPFFSTFQALMEVTDLLLMDIKHLDPQRHRLLTGQDMDSIQDCFRYLSQIGKPIWVRQVLLPGWTAEEGYLRQVRAFLDTLDNVKKVEVLPYHSMGQFKWEALGIPYPLKDAQPPTQEQITLAEQILTGRA